MPVPAEPFVKIVAAFDGKEVRQLTPPVEGELPLGGPPFAGQIRQ